MCWFAIAACGGWCANTECAPCLALYSNLVFITADITAPSACLEPDLQRAPVPVHSFETEMLFPGAAHGEHNKPYALTQREL